MSEEQKECTYTLADGTHYDLNALSAATDYEADAGTDGTKYFLNVCRGVKTELSHVEDPGKVGGFFERADGKGHFSIGEFSTKFSLSPGTQDPVLVYDHGSPCLSNDNEHASTAIRFVCSQADFGAGKPTLIAALPPGPDACHFFFEWKTHVACPTNNASLESGHIIITFVALVFVALLTWFGGHTLYNRFALGRRGLDQFPVPRFGCKTPGLRLGTHTEEQGGESAAPRRRRWGFRRSQRAGYNHLRTEPDEEDALTAARFSLDDDEDDDNDARALGGEVDAWRGHSSGQRTSQEGTVGVHQGLVNL